MVFALFSCQKVPWIKVQLFAVPVRLGGVEISELLSCHLQLGLKTRLAAQPYTTEGHFHLLFSAISVVGVMGRS